jgi:hypothetical protein
MSENLKTSVIEKKKNTTERAPFAKLFFGTERISKAHCIDRPRMIGRE